MDKELPYVSINDRDYLPKEEYEKIEKRRNFNQHFLVGLANSAVVVGISTAYITYADVSKQSLIETAKNLNLETLVFWGGVFLLNLAYAYNGLSKAFRLNKELKNG